MVRSADGKGRTLFDMLTGKNKRDMTPQEFQVHNPLSAKIGCSVSFKHQPELDGLNFFVTDIFVFETKVGNKKHYHTDYSLKATTVGGDKPIRLKLRLIPDEDSPSELGHKIQVLENYYECGWREAEEMNLLEGVLSDPEGVFQIYQDDQGTPYDETARPTYWRVDDVRDPYHARVTILKDVDGDGMVQADELERTNITYWDYHRNTVDADSNQEFREFLSVEMNDETRYFSFYRGRDVEPFQVTVI